MDSKKLRIACLCEPNIIQGLQWALDQTQGLQFEFDLVPAGLKDVVRISKDVDIYFLHLDLGQPLPVESLKNFGGKPGLVGVLHPTPLQLLSIFEVPGLRASSWNGQSFEDIVSKISDLCGQQIQSIRRESFIESLETWLKTQNSWPAVLKWSNSQTGNQSSFYFDEKAPISVGGAQSGADICLENPGTFKYAEFIFFDGAWRFRNLQNGAPFTGNYESGNLRAGDFIEFAHHTFFVKEHPLLEGLKRLIQQSDLPFDTEENTRRPLQQEALSLVDLCKRLMIQGRSGELRVQSEGRYGSIYFLEGKIEDALSGSSMGHKALFRILGWEKTHWKLNINQRKEFEAPSLNMDLADFLSQVETWKKSFERINSRTPPSNIRISVNAKTFFNHKGWSNEEVQVLAAIAESEKVFEVINSCPLEDHLIFERLIQFRKQNVIGVLV